MSIQPKQSGRRRFLRDGAALASLAVGVMRPASGATLEGETPEVPAKDFHSYGERSRFETSVRTGSIGTWGLSPRFRVQDSAARFGWDDHAACTALHCVSRVRAAGHRSPRASSADPRHGGSPSDIQLGGAAALALGNACSFSRV